MVRENHVGKSRDKSGLKKSAEAEMSSKEHEKPLEENLQKIKVADESDKSVCEAKKPKKVDETVTEDSKEEKSSGNLDLDITPPLISPKTLDESYDSDDDITKLKPKKVDETVTEDSKEEKSSGNLDLDITPPLISPNTFDESYDSDDDITKPPNPPKSGLLRSNAEPYPSGGSLIRSNAEPYPSGGSLIRSNTEPYPSGGSLIRSNAEPYPSGGSLIRSNAEPYPSGSSLIRSNAEPNPSGGSLIRSNAEPYPSAGSLIRANTNISLSGSLIFSMLHFQLTWIQVRSVATILRDMWLNLTKYLIDDHFR